MSASAEGKNGPELSTAISGKPRAREVGGIVLVEGNEGALQLLFSETLAKLENREIFVGEIYFRKSGVLVYKLAA